MSIYNALKWFKHQENKRDLASYYIVDGFFFILTHLASFREHVAKNSLRSLSSLGIVCFFVLSLKITKGKRVSKSRKALQAKSIFLFLFSNTLTQLRATNQAFACFLAARRSFLPLISTFRTLGWIDFVIRSAFFLSVTTREKRKRLVRTLNFVADGFFLIFTHLASFREQVDKNSLRSLSSLGIVFFLFCL